MMEGSDKVDMEEVVAVDSTVEGVGEISDRFILGGLLSSPEQAASPSESSSFHSGSCAVSRISTGAVDAGG